MSVSTKRVRFGTHSVKSSSTRGSGSRSGTKATKKAKAKKKPEWDVREQKIIQIISRFVAQCTFVALLQTTVSDLTVHKLSKEEQVRF